MKNSPLSLLALLGKLERVPFDIPEAETEIVAGSFTEYSGRLLAIFRMAVSIEMITPGVLASRWKYRCTSKVMLRTVMPVGSCLYRGAES